MKRVLQLVVLLIQLFDMAIHAATNQLEPLRVASNVLILLWLVFMALGRGRADSRLAGFGAVGGYLLLNLIFLATAGVVNPANGEARVMLFLLVGATVIVSGVLVSTRPQNPNGL